jgi:aminomethyltransferase
MSPTLRASAFHARTAAANRSNAWVVRNGVTLAAAFTDTNDEALAARTNVALADLGARWQLMFEGSRVVEFLQTLMTRDGDILNPGSALKALWLADGGGVRGAAAVARFGRDSFWLLSASRDAEWIDSAAAQYGVSVRDISAEWSGLAIIGPYAGATLEAAGIQSALEPLTFRKVSWRGFEVILSRFGEHGGYELWCIADNGIIAWDRIADAGVAFGLQPVGITAMDVLDIEAGVPRPFRDYLPAADGDAAAPSPSALGLDSLVEMERATFNGRAGLVRTASGAIRRLVGVRIESDIAAPHTPLTAEGRVVGHTLSSAYSPSLRQAIALAQVDGGASKPGAGLRLTLPPSLPSPELRIVGTKVVDLPFLERPDSLSQ